MSFRVVKPDDIDDGVKIEESCYCFINTKESSYSFFIRVSDKERVERAVRSEEEDYIDIEYIQRIYDPVEESDFLAEGKAIIKTSSITGVCFEWHNSTPVFEG